MPKHRAMRIAANRVGQDVIHPPLTARQNLVSALRARRALYAFFRVPPFTFAIHGLFTLHARRTGRTSAIARTISRQPSRRSRRILHPETHTEARSGLRHPGIDNRFATAGLAAALAAESLVSRAADDVRVHSRSSTLMVAEFPSTLRGDVIAIVAATFIASLGVAALGLYTLRKRSGT